MRLFSLLLIPLSLFGAVEALYLSWYGDPTTTMSITWISPKSDPEPLLTYQTKGEAWRFEAGEKRELSSHTVYRIQLQELLPDHTYRFRIGGEGASYTFQTAPATLEKPLSFIAGGDLFVSPPLFQELAREAIEKEPLFVLFGGDLAYALSALPFRLESTEEKLWLSFLRACRAFERPDGRLTPLLFLPGNHDLNRQRGKRLFFDLFAYPTHHLYRTLPFGNYLTLLLLDTGHLDPIAGEQTTWLKQTLEELAPTPYLFAAYHKAAYPSVYPYSGRIPQEIRANWCPLFDRFQVQLAFEHHNHAFKRTYPLKGGAIDPAGTLYLGDGCWGVPPRPVHSGWYLEKSGPYNHFYWVELRPEGASATAVGKGGEVLDEVKIMPLFK